MAFRDDNEALRAQIKSLEARLEDTQEEEEERFETSLVAGRSLVSKGVIRHSLALRGHLSKEGLAETRQLLWAKLGAAEESADEEAPPGDVVLSHTRGKRIVRIVESGGQTHLSIDHHRYGFFRSLSGIVAFAALVIVSMLAAGVHHDWVQMIAGAFAIMVVVFGPIGLLRSWSQESESVDVLKDIVRLAEDDIAERSVRVGPLDEVDVEGSTESEVDAESETSGAKGSGEHSA